MALRSSRCDGWQVVQQASTGRPEVRLLDGDLARLGEEELRLEARTLSEACGAPHSSRSYSHPYALVAWHDGPVGVDIERVERCEAPFADLICTPAERAELDGWLASLWCGKEALTKALGDPLRYEPGRIDSPARWPAGRSGPWRAERLTAPPGHVAWLCWRASQAPTAA
jgi:4'-phosphopantetheinyl transferase superfamily